MCWISTFEIFWFALNAFAGRHFVSSRIRHQDIWISLYYLVAIARAKWGKRNESSTRLTFDLNIDRRNIEEGRYFSSFPLPESKIKNELNHTNPTSSNETKFWITIFENVSLNLSQMFEICRACIRLTQHQKSNNAETSECVEYAVIFFFIFFILIANAFGVRCLPATNVCINIYTVHCSALYTEWHTFCSLIRMVVP